MIFAALGFIWSVNIWCLNYAVSYIDIIPMYLYVYLILVLSLNCEVLKNSIFKRSFDFWIDISTLNAVLYSPWHWNAGSFYRHRSIFIRCSNFNSVRKQIHFKIFMSSFLHLRMVKRKKLTRVWQSRGAINMKIL